MVVGSGKLPSYNVKKSCQHTSQQPFIDSGKFFLSGERENGSGKLPYTESTSNFQLHLFIYNFFLFYLTFKFKEYWLIT